MCAAKDNWLSNSFDMFSSPSKQSDAIIINDSDDSYNERWTKSRNCDNIDRFSSDSSSDYEDAKEQFEDTNVKKITLTKQHTTNILADKSDILISKQKSRNAYDYSSKIGDLPKKHAVKTELSLACEGLISEVDQLHLATNTDTIIKKESKCLLDSKLPITNMVASNNTLQNNVKYSEASKTNNSYGVVDNKAVNPQKLNGVIQKRDSDVLHAAHRTSVETSSHENKISISAKSDVCLEKTSPINKTKAIAAPNACHNKNNDEKSGDVKSTTFTQMQKDENQFKYVPSKTPYANSVNNVNKEQNSSKMVSANRDQLIKELEKCKHVIKVTNLAALPDNGKKLFDKVANIEKELAILDLNKKDERSSQQTDQATNTISSVKISLSSSSSQSASSLRQIPSNHVVMPSSVSAAIGKVPVAVGKSDSHTHASHKSHFAKSVSASAMLSSSDVPPKEHRDFNKSSSNKSSVEVYSGASRSENPYATGKIAASHVREIEPQWMTSASERMYTSQPQQYSLYHGKLTMQQKREVTDVTTAAIEQLHEQLASCPSSEAKRSDPEGLTVPLMNHQKQAVAWLLWREKQIPQGGILADDMGLGKTLTMISLILKSQQLSKTKERDKEKDDEEWLQKYDRSLIKSNATFIICPASVLHQWKAEIERRCKKGLLSVLVYHGPDRTKDINRVAKCDIVLTTYDIIRSEIGPDETAAQLKLEAEMPANDDLIPPADCPQPLLLRVVWQRIILDEAHTIKNHKSQTAIAVCRLRAKYRWALSGTPIQNNLLDMYSLLRYLRCSPFDEYKVWKRQVDNKTDKGSKRLNVLITCLLLRRTKSQLDAAGKPLVSLPNKSVELVNLTLSSEERTVYDDVFKQSRAALMNYLQNNDDSVEFNKKPQFNNNYIENDRVNQGSEICHKQELDVRPSVKITSRSNTGGQVLLFLLRLRQCCSHLSLLNDAIVKDDVGDDGIEQDLISQLQDLSIGGHDFASVSDEKSSSKFDASSISTKLRAVSTKLQEIKQSSKGMPRQKSVIVSQWTQMLDILESHLVKSGFHCCTIKGSINPKRRNEIVESFNNDSHSAEVLLLSLRAGGVGLNLIGGNHLFILDLHWNPALEQQACDRIYRVGQSRDVFIYKFICSNTIEEKIIQLQERKLGLANSILTGGATSANKLTLADLKLIFGLDQKPPASAAAWSLH